MPLTMLPKISFAMRITTNEPSQQTAAPTIPLNKMSTKTIGLSLADRYIKYVMGAPNNQDQFMSKKSFDHVLIGVLFFPVLAISKGIKTQTGKETNAIAANSNTA